MSIQNDTVGIEFETLDPRIQIELEKLNKCCDEINKLENEFEETKIYFENSKHHYLENLEHLEKTIGQSIKKSKPYFDLIRNLPMLKDETHKAAQEFQKANSLYKTAKETLTVAENGLNSKEIPYAWQEHLSETILKVNSSKKDSDQTENVYRLIKSEYEATKRNVEQLESNLQKHIIRAEVYYHESLEWNNQSELKNLRLCNLDSKMNEKKYEYKAAMEKLSVISEEIHKKRKTNSKKHIP